MNDVVVKPRVRLWLTSVIAGCAISLALALGGKVTRLAFWFPPFWPGLFFSWLVIVITHGESWGSRFGLTIATVGNAFFYTFLAFRVLHADAVSRGRVARIL